MQHNKIFKYILDIESIIQEIEMVKNIYNTFEKFDNDLLAKRAIDLVRLLRQSFLFPRNDDKMKIIR